jgi:hypothetical protein
VTRVYLASPNNQVQAEACRERPVLLSYASWDKWLRRYTQAFGRVLVDSGAYSELSGRKKVNLGAYIEWVAGFAGLIDAWAGLDDISGDWQRSLKNYEAGGFPTFHDSDPPELLDDLVAMARERGGWIGIGLLPPRQGKETFIRETLERIPEGLHVHGWACRLYSGHRRFDSFDSTNWWRDGMKLRQKLPWLTYGECLDLQIKRIVRGERAAAPAQKSDQKEFRFP